MSVRSPYSSVGVNDDHYDDDDYDMVIGTPHLVRGFSELSFHQHQAKKVIKHRVKEGKISKDEANIELKKAYHTLAHHYSHEELEKEYQTSLINGLTDDQVKKRLLEDGLNELTPQKQTPWWMRLLKCLFGNLLNLLLACGGSLSFFAYGLSKSEHRADLSSLWLGLALWIVVLVTGLFVFYQEGKSSDLMGALSAMKPKNVNVMRDGRKQDIEPINLVNGDVIYLNLGMLIPADIRIVSCSEDLEVDNSSLTGESDPQLRDCKADINETAAESNNLCFFGTLVLNGKGQGIVIQTGDHTFMGRTAALASGTDNNETPIAREIHHFVSVITVIAFFVGVALFIAQQLKYPDDVIGNIIFLIGIVIANVPEALMAVVTVQLTLTAKRMYAKNVQVKQLGSVETLGSTSVICSDKTGTLTTNVMTVQHCYFDLKERVCDTTHPLHALEGDFYDKPSTGFDKLVRIGALCNNASFIDDCVDPSANATESAILKFVSGHIAADYRMNIREYRKKHRLLHEIPFNSRNKWQVSIHALPIEMEIDNELNDRNDRCIVQMKGATERILKLCTKYSILGVEKDLDASVIARIEKDMSALGERGERVLAFAELVLPMDPYNINILEPAIEEKYDTELKQTTSDDNNNNNGGFYVFVMFSEQATLIEIIGGEGELTVMDLMICIEKSDSIGMACAQQRLAFGDRGLLSSANTLSELGVKPASLLHLMRGPYKFFGNDLETCNWPSDCLCLIGLFAMIDPPRPGVPEAVRTCQSAGIKVIMVTGDHPVTAAAIAKQVHIIGNNAKTLSYSRECTNAFDDGYSAVVVPGWELQNVLNCSEESPNSVIAFWNNVLAIDNIVFARTSPAQKLLIVSAVQERGGIVAVTGDGVNDSPALKKADIGVAMGITGTEVAQAAADMILLDDNFATIILGIEQGRIIFDNLKKSISYTLAKNMPEVLPFVFALALGIPYPLTVLLLLCVDLGTDLMPAISLSMESKEFSIMNRAPRDPLVDRLGSLKLIFMGELVVGMFAAIAGFFAYFVVFSSFGLSPQFLLNIDQFQTFSFSAQTNVDGARDAYYLWCFSDANACYYYPNFYNESVPHTFHGQVQSYYDQYLWNSWQSNDAGYAKESKHYLIHVWNAQSLKNTSSLTMNALNGRDGNGSKCIANVTDSCDFGTYLSWKQFYGLYWPYIYSQFNENTLRNSLFVNRRCWDNDYMSVFYKRTTVKDQPPPFCNYDSQVYTNDKYRTYQNSDNSLFPIALESRNNALQMAQTGYFVTIVVMQLSDLITVRTRVSSVFEQGMTNALMNFGIFFELCLAATLVYLPICNLILGTAPLLFYQWCSGLPFAIFVIIFHEIRKGIIRKDLETKKCGFVTRNTLW